MALVIGQWYEYTGTPSSSTTTNAGGVDVMLVSQNSTTGTSLVRVRPWAKKLSGTGIYKLDAQTMTISVNNQSQVSQTKYDLRNQTNNTKLYLKDSYPFLKYSGSGYLLDGAYVYDFTVQHDSSGNANAIPLYALIPLQNSASGRNHIVNTTIDLPQILVKSTCVWSANYIGDPIYITITKPKPEYTSTLRIQFDAGVAYPIATKTSDTSIEFNFTEQQLSQLLSNYSSQKQATAQLVLTTFNGDTSLGSNTYTFTMNIKLESPTVTATIIDTNTTTTTLTGDNTKIIAYYSKPKVTINATPKNGATISFYYMSWDTYYSNTQETTLEDGVTWYEMLVQATDSRDLSTTTTYNLSTLNKWVNYFNVGISSINLHRLETTSNTVKLELQGNWFNQSFGATNNNLTLKFRYKESGGTFSSYTTLTPTISGSTFEFNGNLGTNFNYQKAYQFEVVVSDALSSVSRTIDVSKGISIIRVADDYVDVRGELRIEGTDMDTYINNSFMIVSQTISIGAISSQDGSYDNQVNITPQTGYTPIGIIGVNASGAVSASLTIPKIYIDNGKIVYSIFNSNIYGATANDTIIEVKILFIKG